MKILIFKGSPRETGNTNSMVAAFAGRLKEVAAGLPDDQRGEGPVWEEFNLYDMNIQPCRACRMCQADWSRPGCVIDDDMQELFARILDADIILLATPIYSWYATPPIKALLDRCVYALNKYYGLPENDNKDQRRGPSIWKGKQLALITTCGYPQERGADLLDEGLRRYCRHSGLTYRGMLAERHLGYGKVFMDEEKAMRARDFCDILIQQKREKK